MFESGWRQSFSISEIRFYSEFAWAATDLKTSFPKSFWVALAAQLFKPLAIMILKSAFRDAAKDLGLSISDTTLDFLADLAVSALLSA